MPTSLYQITQVFGLPSGESGQFSYWVADATGTATLAAAVSFGDAVNTSLGAATAFKALFPSTIVWPPVRVSQVDITNGRVLATAVGASTVFPSGSSTGVLPPQIAVVVTLRTALAGSTHRGRMYLPGPTTAALTAVGRLNTTNTPTIAAAIAAAFAAGITAEPDLQVFVYSRLLRSVTVVTGVDVGDVLDTERRRRDKLLEVRSPHTI